ncbi:hypothetical protein B224_0068 [Aeromonas media WS]|nr:hypothetical protein B224_0068 [Aeromonas media WS]
MIMPFLLFLSFQYPKVAEQVIFIFCFSYIFQQFIYQF